LVVVVVVAIVAIVVVVVVVVVVVRNVKCYVGAVTRTDATTILGIHLLQTLFPMLPSHFLNGPCGI